MAFTLKIDTDNAAFHDEATGNPAPAPEVARILRLIADSLTLSDIPLTEDERQPVRDINGGTVGHWEYQTDENVCDNCGGGIYAEHGYCRQCDDAGGIDEDEEEDA